MAFQLGIYSALEGVKKHQVLRFRHLNISACICTYHINYHQSLYDLKRVALALASGVLQISHRLRHIPSRVLSSRHQHNSFLGTATTFFSSHPSMPRAFPSSSALIPFDPNNSKQYTKLCTCFPQRCVNCYFRCAKGTVRWAKPGDKTCAWFRWLLL
jgi:hypothetical protein